MDGVPDLLLDGVGDTVLYSSLSYFLASQPFALLARGNFLIGEANFFHRVVVRLKKIKLRLWVTFL